MVRSILYLVALVTALLALSPRAEAWPYSFEFGGAYPQYTAPNALLVSQGKSSSTTVSSGYDVPLTLAIALQEREQGLLFSLGVQSRYLNGTSGAGDAFSVVPVSPIFRVEFWRLVLGVGYTPFIFDSPSFKKDGDLNSMLTLEAQFLFPITPEIDFGISASKETFKSTLYGNAASIMEYGAFFRLNFGMSTAEAGERQKFKGWRYPLGSPLN